MKKQDWAPCIHDLVLKGFKSFASRSALTLEPGITAVVGPNGSEQVRHLGRCSVGARRAGMRTCAARPWRTSSSPAPRRKASVSPRSISCSTIPTARCRWISTVAITRRMYRNSEQVPHQRHRGPAHGRAGRLLTQAWAPRPFIPSPRVAPTPSCQSKPEDRFARSSRGRRRSQAQAAQGEKRAEAGERGPTPFAPAMWRGEVARQLGTLELRPKKARTYQNSRPSGPR